MTIIGGNLSIKRRLQEAALSQVAEFAVKSAALATAVFGVWLWSAGTFSEFRWWTVPIGIALALGAVLLMNRIHRRKSAYRCHYPAYDHNFVVLHKELVYSRDVNGVLTFRRKLRVKALRTGLDGFADRYLWTGGAAGMPSVVSGAVGIERIERPGIWNFFEVKFGRNLNMGEEHEFAIEQIAEDSDMMSRPFFSTSLEEPTSSLVMILSIPADEQINHCVTEVL